MNTARDDIAQRLRKNGWRQGDVLKDEDLASLGVELNVVDDGKPILIVLSQSCDLLHHDFESEPYVEIAVGSVLEEGFDPSLWGNYTRGKQPRQLLLPVQAEDDVRHVMIRPWNRIQIQREKFADIEPDDTRYLLEEDLIILTRWIANRYTRAALPDGFNELLKSTEKKQKKKYSGISPSVSDVRVLLQPARELEEGESYDVKLLVLIPRIHQGHRSEVEKSSEGLKNLMESSGKMRVDLAVSTEDEVSYGFVRDYVSLPLDHFSSGDEPRPLS